MRSRRRRCGETQFNIGVSLEKLQQSLNGILKVTDLRPSESRFLVADHTARAVCVADTLWEAEEVAEAS